jgi:putative hydrolase of the HAD superfamily
MIRAVIFDLGGVLIDDPSPGMIRYFASALGLEEATFYDLEALPLPAFQKGLISEEAFWKKLSPGLKERDVNAGSLWQEAFRSEYKPKEEMFPLASTLRRRGYKIGLLSNIEAPSAEFFNEQEYDIFDAAIFSCNEGTCKPERRIYQIALGRLGVEPGEAVFIDDRRDFVRGAKEAGVKAIHFLNPLQVKADLGRLSVETEDPEMQETGIQNTTGKKP